MSKKSEKSKGSGGLQIRTNVEAKDDWLRRVGGGRSAHNMSDLIGRHPFRNTLPEPPMDPKFLKPSEEVLMKQIKYKTTSIESRYKYPILTEPDLGVTVNLIDPNAYHFYTEDEKAPELDEKDRFLAYLQVDPPGTKKTQARPRPRVAWLRKTEYMANDLYEPAAKYKSQLDTMQTFRDIAKRKNTELSRTVEDRLNDIEESFQCATTVPVHPTNKDLKPVNTYPVLPNLDMWENQYTTIGFDDDAYSATGHTQEEANSKAVIKAFEQLLDEDGKPEQFVGYMLPKKRKRDPDSLDEEEEEAPKDQEDYDWVRNYSFQHEGDADEQHLILCENGAGDVIFVVVKSKLAVHRIAQIKENLANQFKPSRVDITRRPFRSTERNARGRRKREGLSFEYSSEPDSEPEPEPEPEPEAPMIEDPEDEDGVKAAAVEDDISGDEAKPKAITEAPTHNMDSDSD